MLSKLGGKLSNQRSPLSLCRETARERSSAANHYLHSIKAMDHHSATLLCLVTAPKHLRDLNSCAEEPAAPGRLVLTTATYQLGAALIP